MPAVADRFKATPFDIEGVFWSDRGDKCRFDVMVDEFGLGLDALGFSRMYRDDLAQLEAAMPLYDAYYRWCRDATEETHS